MEEVNRRTEPQVVNFDQISIPEHIQSELSNGIPVYLLPSNGQEVVKIDFVFEAGFWNQPQSFVASLTNAMLSAGTKTRKSEKIAESFDFYGAHLKLDSDRHSSTVSLITLEKHVARTLEIIEDIIKNSTFPESEFETLVQNRRQEFLVSIEKSETIAYRQFSELLYGEDHPYGKMTSASDFKVLKNSLLRDFYNAFYTAKSCKIIATGKITENLSVLLEQHFGQKIWRTEEPSQGLLEYRPVADLVYFPRREFFIGRPQANQSSIRLGTLSINQSHADFAKLKVVNTLLGGYFGSRLMSNIREEKGYTYGISSILHSARETGSFWISTEVGAGNTMAAVNEIYKEVDRLSAELVPMEELERVKQYMFGEMIRFFDGPFAISDLLKSYLEYGLSLTDFNKNIDAIHSITPEEVQALSKTYLDANEFIEVIVGVKK